MSEAARSTATETTCDTEKTNKARAEPWLTTRTTAATTDTAEEEPTTSNAVDKQETHNSRVNAVTLNLLPSYDTTATLAHQPRSLHNHNTKDQWIVHGKQGRLTVAAGEFQLGMISNLV